MVKVESITVTFGMRKIITDLSFEILNGTKAVFTGESGSGKSTLLKTLIGRYLPDEGTITVADKPFSIENLSNIRRQMYYLPQEIVPQGDETVREYLHYPFSLSVNRKKSFPEDSMHQLLDRLRLDEAFLTQPLLRLSGGERKRVGLLLGLLLDRPLMLLDEPTAGVDSSNSNTIAELLFGEQRHTVIVVTHDESLIAKSDSVIELKNERYSDGGEG